MRTVLVTGPGGAGRSTVAAATALAAARGGTRTLLLSADSGDRLTALLGTPVTTEPVPAAPGLDVLRVDTDDRFRSDLVALQGRARSALDMVGAARLDAEEITTLPGAAELALLRALRDAATGGHDLVVVDLPPAPQALAVLALPEQLRRWLGRLLPPERQAARALRPLLGRLAGVPVPADLLYETAGRWDTELAAVQAVVTDPATSVRLVAEPGPAGEDAVRTTLTALALFGLPTDVLVANRVLPSQAAGTWADTLLTQQRKTLAAWEAEHASAEVGHLGRDPQGLDDLGALGVPAVGPAPGTVAWTVEDRLADDGVLVWHIPLPGAAREDLDLVRLGDELVVTAGPFRRVVALPSALRRCTVGGAGLRDGVLRIRFTPDPQLWPRTR